MSMIGKTLGHYKIVDPPLGKGGMREVYRAKDLKLGRMRRSRFCLQYSVTPDGQRFLMIKDVTATKSKGARSKQIIVVLNWLEELRQRVPVK
jgi:hypothetical protein